MAEIQPHISSLGERYAQYFSNVFFLIFAWLIYSANQYYSDLLNPAAWAIISIYVAGYIIIGFIFYTFIIKKINQNTVGYTLLRALNRISRQIMPYLRSFTKDASIKAPVLYPEEKTALLYSLVKFFYIPLMVSFIVGNIAQVSNAFSSLSNIPWENRFTIANFNQFINPLFYYFLISCNTLIYCFSYMFEAGFLKNRIRSVEPTALGWLVALICYPPFINITLNYVGWAATDFPIGKNETITFILGIFKLLLFTICVWSDLALGTKASNLTNRGIVSRGPYAIVRHPAYFAKNLAWWISMIPTLSLPGIVTMLAWSFIYYLRSITEERHLLKDPDYQQYCAKVRYRFIPFVW
jgi:protein-S-isoprenylcysteine O-methyltransferase Ste14